MQHPHAHVAWQLHAGLLLPMLMHSSTKPAQASSPRTSMSLGQRQTHHREAGRRNGSAFAPGALIKCITALCIRLALAWVCGVGSCSHALQLAADRTAYWDVLCCMRCRCDQTQHDSAEEECLAVHDLRSVEVLYAGRDRQV